MTKKLSISVNKIKTQTFLGNFIQLKSLVFVYHKISKLTIHSIYFRQSKL